MDYTVTLSDELQAEVLREVTDVNNAKRPGDPDLVPADLVQRHAETHWAQRRRVTEEAAFARVMARARHVLLQLITLTPEQQDIVQAVVQAEIERLRPSAPENR